MQANTQTQRSSSEKNILTFGILPAEGCSTEVAARVHAARLRQRERLYGSGLRTNADLDEDALAAFTTPDLTGQKLFAQGGRSDAIVVAGLYAHLTRCADRCGFGERN